MFEIDTSLVYSWSSARQGASRKPNYVNINCPYCGASLANRPITEDGWSAFGPSVNITRFPCAACNNHAFLFLVYPEQIGSPNSLNGELFLYPTPSIVQTLPANIKTLSPRFVSIYEQAMRAERFNLDELVGVGYRKALEVLVKDYAINKHPDEAEKIKGKWLSECIEAFIADPRIKATAKKTATLGNDQAHYEIRNPSEDLRSLKEILNATLMWIDLDLTTEQLVTKS